MAVIMKGSEVVASMRERVLAEARALSEKGVAPCLAVVRLGAKPEDLAYERSAVKRCESMGVSCRVFEYDETISEDTLAGELEKLSGDGGVHGILLFRPLPKHISERAVKDRICPQKDVDCLNSRNVAKVFEGDALGFSPCTPEAVMEMLRHYEVGLGGKRVTVIGRSLVVGKPLAMLMMKENATVTVCHTKTRALAETCRSAEILVAAAGKARMVTEEFLSPGQVVVDVGMSLDADGKLCGDVDFAAAERICGMVTPVPGGVGTVTASVLAAHTVRAAKDLAGHSKAEAGK